MDYKLIISEDANKDMEDIVHYIVFELGNLSTAEIFLDNVEKVIGLWLIAQKCIVYVVMLDTVIKGNEKSLLKIISCYIVLTTKKKLYLL